jgi:SAM-dependent methyltransferase
MTEYSPNPDELMALFKQKYGHRVKLGPGPELRLRYEYFTPDDHYEALVRRLLKSRDAWCDVGCGRDIFPSNAALARELADRSGYVYGIDPDDNIKDNPFLSERFQGVVEDCPTTRRFDLITLRMVAEHIVDPARALGRVAQLLKPGGRLIIYTPHKWAPMSIAASIVPFSWHNTLKRLLWDTEARDTFPTQYKLNCREDLLRHCSVAGLQELHYQRIDDCRISDRYPTFNRIELQVRRWLRTVGLAYPEACILAVYAKPLVETATG